MIAVMLLALLDDRRWRKTGQGSASRTLVRPAAIPAGHLHPRGQAGGMTGQDDLMAPVATPA